jgi:hypothetical protein
MIDKIVDNLSLKAYAYLLILAGPFALIASIVSASFDTAHPLAEKLPAIFIVATLALLCAGLGFERLGPIEKLKILAEDLGSMNRGVRSRWLPTGAEVYRAAERVVSECRDGDTVKGTDLLPNDQKLRNAAFTSYVNALAAKSAAGGVLYHVVYTNDVDGCGERGVARRREIFQKHNVGSRFTAQPYKTAGAMPMEVLITPRHVLFCFPEGGEGNSNPLNLGVLIEDSGFALRLNEWYGHYLDR